MKTIITPVAAGILLAFVVSARAADPRTNSWFTAYAGQYARAYTNDAMKAAGTTLTTWSNGTQTQSLPAYDGVQEVYSSTNWVYVRSTGLASYNMGPWQNGAFPNLPVNQKLLYRLPRTNGVPTVKTVNGGGQIGIFVDSVEMFNSWDAFYWNGTTDTSGAGTGNWNRDAYVNEGATFDAGYAHQQNTGVYHYHADPIGLRYLLGDHADYNPATKTYFEDTNAPAKHSPILGWVADGFPIYGPYGYSNPTNAGSGIRRMISGYVPRNGLNGTDNLSTNGAARSTIPVWAQIFYNTNAYQTGPAVSTNVSSYYPFGRYMEDNAYLGDLTNAATGTNYQQGVDFDLDRFNGRICITPEFPNGTYAYFVAIDSNGLPVFPYNIGRAFYGSPAGGSVPAITETVVTNFLGDTNLVQSLNSPNVQNGTVTLSWSALEGGSYQVEATTNLANSSGWMVLATGVPLNQITGGYADTTSLDKRFYRVGRTAVSNFDSAGTTIITTNFVAAPGGGASRGQAVIMTIKFTAPPNLPPAGSPVASVTVGSLTAISATCTAAGTAVAIIVIPASATTGAQNVVVTFSPPPNQSQGPVYTLTGGFTIN